MNRRTTLLLTSMTFFGLAIGVFPQVGFAESDLLTGLWQLNAAKSKAPVKSQTVYIQGEGQNRKVTLVGITGAGNAQSFMFSEVVEDSKSHPVIGLPGVDAQTYTRVDAHTVDISRLKDGKILQKGTWVVSPDGNMLTATFTGINANGQQVNNSFVYDKQ